jgi:ubiquitin-activating enzyme E1
LKSLTTEKATSFEDCIVWARLLFEDWFNNSIQQLLFTLPKDSVTSSGAPFWSGPKRAPDPIAFNPENPLHLDFVVSAANLHAFNYKIPGSRDVEQIKKVSSNVMVPEFTPKKGVKIQVNENEQAQQGDDHDEIDVLVKALPPASNFKGFKLEPCDFEKVI